MILESFCGLHISVGSAQNQLLRVIPGRKPPERILEYLEMETGSVTQSLLADLSKSEDLYNAQKFVHIVDAFTTDWSLRCCPLISERGGSKICSWLSFQSRRAIFSYSCGLLDPLNTTEQSSSF